MTEITTKQNITNFTNNELLQNIINITPADPTSTANIILNNTFKVNYTNPLLDTNNATNSNSTISLKDRTDGHFKELYLDNNDLYIIPQDYIINTPQPVSAAVKFLREDDIDIINNILDNDDNSLSYGNINVSNTSIIRFLETDLSSDTSLIGFRQNSGNIEFRNANDGVWTRLYLNGSNGISNFYNLTDVNITKASVQTYEYIKFNGSQELINSNLSISDDNTPQLGGQLSTNDFNIQFTSNTGLLDAFGNIALQIESSSNTNPNYLMIRKERNSGDEDVVNLYASSDVNTNVNMRISTRGSGDLEIDLNDATTPNNMGDFIIKTNEFNLADVNTFNMSTGKFIGSLDFIVLSGGGYSTDVLSPTNVELSTETLILQVNGNDNRYYISLIDGTNGQKANVVYETSGSNNQVSVSFSNSTGSIKNIGTGTGLADKLIFTEAGQSAVMQYYQFNGYDINSSRNRWQILNTACLVE